MVANLYTNEEMCNIISEFLFCANVENCVNPIKEQRERYLKLANQLIVVHDQLKSDIK